MNRNYVRGASITASASQDEIQNLLTGFGATDVQCTREDGMAAIAFSSGARRFRIVLALPRGADDPLQPPSGGCQATKTAQETARQRWRQLSQLIRAKLDAVAAGIVTFDQEFLAYMLTPQGDQSSRPQHPAQPRTPQPGPPRARRTTQPDPGPAGPAHE